MSIHNFNLENISLKNKDEMKTFWNDGKLRYYALKKMTEEFLEVKKKLIIKEKL